MVTMIAMARRHTYGPRAFLALAVLVCSAPSASAQVLRGGAQLFATADRCMACHNGLVTPAGEDVSIGFLWRPTMMANSARDPYWRAAVRREALDRPAAAAAIQDECSKCHMPMMRYAAHVDGQDGAVFANPPTGGIPLAAQLAADGVSCSMCHQIAADNLGTEESLVGGFHVDETASPNHRAVFGPYQIDSGRVRVMRSATGFGPTEASHLRTSELCATCHTLYTHAMDADGNVIGRLPEQVPYQEWRHSGYAPTQTCQSCHMPVVEDSVAITGVVGHPRAGVHRHVFRGGNFVVLRMLNQHRVDLGVTTLPQELDAAALRTVTHLETITAQLALGDVALTDGALAAEVTVRNLAGHKFPTAYPSRRAWLHVAVRDGSGHVVFESGALEPNGCIVGNDNDMDARRFEPHYTAIDDPTQVQIYEPILGGPDGTVTTGLLTASQYLKDNRLLPAGFDKATADNDIAVHGRALDDPDFGPTADRVRYRVRVGSTSGPYRIVAELWYQPIGYRWANNLRSYEALETTRFTSYFETMGSASAVLIASAEAEVR
jgi:hypothetical protein